MKLCDDVILENTKENLKTPLVPFKKTTQVA